jgi:hypothetical protein
VGAQDSLHMLETCGMDKTREAVRASPTMTVGRVFMENKLDFVGIIEFPRKTYVERTESLYCGSGSGQEDLPERQTQGKMHEIEHGSSRGVRLADKEKKNPAIRPTPTRFVLTSINFLTELVGE